MKSSISSPAAGQLRTLVFGQNSGSLKPLALDSNGNLILSASNSIDATATNLDIRDLSSATDSTVITATNLDIRNLTGAQDSVQRYSRAFAQDSESGTILALGTRIFLTKNVSNYVRNDYLVMNTSGVGLTVTLQIAPIDSDSYYVNDGSSFSLLAGGSQFFTPGRLMKFARIQISALLLGSATVYYFGQA